MGQNNKKIKKVKKIQQKSYIETLSSKQNFLGKTVKFSVDAWKQTFPDDKSIQAEKMKKAKEQAKKLREQQLNKIEYTEEELAEMQEKMPEWKRQALVETQQKQQKESLSSQFKGKVKNKFNQTKFAKDLYQSDNYKDYQEFRTEMNQFKEDLKDHVSNSPSNLVQGSLMVMDKATQEHSTARAIKEMRKIDPEFDVFDLEKESTAIFESSFNLYLEGDIDMIEKCCSEQALGYFKTLIKQRNTNNMTPKHKQLWTCDKSQFDKAVFPDGILPVFRFKISIQEIHCMVDMITGKIVDGDDERIMRTDYMFGIRLHHEPDLETIGHKWEIVEMQPIQQVKMLV